MTGKKLIVLNLIVLLAAIQEAPAQKALGEWSTHLSYNYSKELVITGSKVYCSALGGLFYYDLEDNTVNTLSKTDGLSDNGVSAMSYDKDRDLLVLAYENANLDLISDEGIINIPDIMKKQIMGEKSVNDIYFRDNLAYLSCGFGIVVLNLERLEIKDTYYIGDEGAALNVNQTTSDGTYIYAATDQGVKRARLDDPFLINSDSWDLLTDLPYYSGPFNQIAYFNGVLFTSSVSQDEDPDRVYMNQGSGWTTFSAFNGTRCSELKVSDQHLILVEDKKIDLISGDFLLVRQFETNKPLSAAVDGTLSFWVADYGGGLIHEENGAGKSHTPNGPYYSNVFKMASADGIVYATGGGLTTSWNNLFRSAQLYTYNGNHWSSFLNYDHNDLLSLAAAPDEPGHLFISSWSSGLLELRDNVLVNTYTPNNSSLQSIYPGENFIRIGGMVYDAAGNLWMNNSGVAEPLSVMKKDGSWKSFKVDNLLSDLSLLGDMLVSRTGDIWMILPKGHGLFAMRTNNTVDDETDDEYYVIDVVDKNGKVITNDIYSFAEDLNGNIWLGTNQGILVYYNPSSLFNDGHIFAQKIIIPRNDGTNYGDPLLSTEKVTSIEVDGANRKWLGTEGGGAFLVSDNGFEQIYSFSTLNSPLISDIITDICINDENGEVFFGTGKGIVSFRGEATGGDEDYSAIRVYPNPVRESYTGNIAISGLVANSEVKITDISGNLVFETTSLGGQAIWDGNNMFGERVSTGVYLVFLSNKDGQKAAVTKILFIH